MEKKYPKIGDKLYLTRGSDWYNTTMDPYTVVRIDHGKAWVQECKLIFPVLQENHNWTPEQKEYYMPMVGQRVQFYDTVAESIEPDPTGRVIGLSWSPKKKQWQYDPHKTGYPSVAVFGQWRHQPYLN